MAIISNPKTLDLEDVQGMVTRGYSKLMETAYFLLKVENPEKAKSWIKETLRIMLNKPFICRLHSRD